MKDAADERRWTQINALSESAFIRVNLRLSCPAFTSLKATGNTRMLVFTARD